MNSYVTLAFSSFMGYNQGKLHKPDSNVSMVSYHTFYHAEDKRAKATFPVFFLLQTIASFFQQESEFGLPVFPGIEGFGFGTKGGAGGEIVRVTNLNKSGEGSLSAALEMSGYLTVKPVFQEFNADDWDLEKMTRK